MSPVLRPSRRPSAQPAGLPAPGPVALSHRSIAARAQPSAGVPGLALVVVLDGLAVPAVEHFRHWSRTLAEHGYTSMRTGALSPRQAVQAEAAGLRCVQELALLDRAGPLPRLPRSLPTERLRRRDLPVIARIDRAAFGDTWWLDAGMLADIRAATPAHRARVVRAGGELVGFLVSGRAGTTGYVQRLAVHPDAHRRGVASALLADSLRWMRRARVQRVFVNTHVENLPALELYRAHGFDEMPERLRVFEGPTWSAP